MAASDAIKTQWRDIITPKGGSLTVADTLLRKGLYVTSISINSDTILDTCTGFDEAGFPIDFIADPSYNWTGTLLSGSLKFAGKNRRIAVVKLTSGNVDLNKIKD